MQSGNLANFLEEVSEQPEALRDLLRFYSSQEGKDLLSQWKDLVDEKKRVQFIGMGTSEIVGLSVIPNLSVLHIDANVVDAGEWLHYGRFSTGVKVLISPEGKAAETRLLARELFSADDPPIVISNDKECALAQHSKFLLPLCAGDQESVSTKSYVNSLALLHLMTKCLRSPEALEGALDRLQRLSIEMLAHDFEAIVAASEVLADQPTLHLIARGPALVCAHQVSRAYMEYTKTYANAFTGGAFRHGPLELSDLNHRAIIFLPGGKTFDRMFRLARELHSKGSKIVVITDQEVTRERFPVLHVPDFGEDLFPISAITAQELLMQELGHRRGEKTQKVYI
jgi:glutamine---fructose-6-phosphate transaminase (isomerizing)